MRNHPVLNAAKEDFQSKWERLASNLAKSAPPVMWEAKTKVVPRHAIRCHPGFIRLMLLPKYVNVVIIAKVKQQIKQHANQDRTPAMLTPCRAFPARRVNFRGRRGMSTATSVLWGICNRNQNNRLATKQQLEKWLLKEVLRLLSFQKGPRSMHQIPVVSKHVPPEPRAMIHPTSRVKSARLANPVPKEPLNANPVAKANSAMHPVPRARIARYICFKIKMQCPA